MKASRAAKLLAAAIGAVALIAGAATVGALTSSGSQQFSQGASGMTGSLEVGDYFAGAVAVGDFDGDGYGDVIAGAAFENFGSKADVGLVHIIYGTSTGLSTTNDATLHQGSPGVPGAPERGDMFGSAVAVGDFDNDGYDDAVVGTAGEDVRTKADAGGFSILYGSSGGLSGSGARTFTAATKGVKGPAEPYAYLGNSVTTGDFNNDGYDDIAVAAPGSGSNNKLGSGAVHVLFGSKAGIRKIGDQRIHQDASGVAGEREANDAFGSALATGDFNHDRKDDLAVGIPGESGGGTTAAGAVQVFNGSRSGLVLSSGLLIDQSSGDLSGANEDDDLFGASLSAGDFNGNKYADLAIGSPGEAAGSRTASGKVHVVYGSTNGLRLTGSRSFSQSSTNIRGKPQAGDEFGWSLVAADFNNNKRVDLAIGVPGEAIGTAQGAGIVHVLFGTSNGLKTKKHQWYWPGNNGIPGRAVSNGGFSRALAAGDIDGDGRADLVVGAPGQVFRGKGNAGGLIVIFG